MLVKISPLETDRLELRPTSQNDLKVIHIMRTDLDNQRYIDRPIPMNLEATRLHVEMVINGNEDMRWYNWSIYKKQTGIMAGTIGLWRFSEDRRRAELGYELVLGMHKKGIMTEAIAPVLEFGFNILELETIDAVTHWENLPSIRLLEKHEFILDPDYISEEGPDFRRFYQHRPY